MSDLHVLVDFENVQPTFDDVSRLAPGLTEVWLFHGRTQVKLAQQFKDAHAGVTAVPISKTGKNALDFHLSFYLGYVAAKNPDCRLVVIANDKGYDPMIVHAKELGFTTERVGFKVKKTVEVNKKLAVKKAVPASQKPAAKKAIPAKKTVAKKAAVKKPTATPAKKTAVVKKLPVAKALLEVQTKLGAATAQFDRIAKGLANMGDKRPGKLKSLLRHLASMLGKDATPLAIDAMSQELQRAGRIAVDGDEIRYLS